MEANKCLVCLPDLSDSRSTDSFLGCFNLGFFKPGGLKTSRVYFSPLANRLRNSFALALFY